MEHGEKTKRPKWFRPAPVPQWYKRLSSVFRTYFQTQYLVDVIFHCADGLAVGAHKLIMCHASPLLNSILANHEVLTEDNTLHVNLTDVDSKVMADFVESIYLGAVPTDTTTYLQCKQLAQQFQLFCQSTEVIREEKASAGQLMKVVRKNVPSKEDEEVSTIVSASSAAVKEEFDVQDEESQVQIVRTETGEVLLVMCQDPLTENDKIKRQIARNGKREVDNEDEEDLELKSFKQENVNEVKEHQNRRCPICGEAAIDHRVEIRGDEDKKRMGIPLVPANASLKFLYKCCVVGCPFHTSRNLKHARAFNFHVNKHDVECQGVPSTSSSKKCPLCHKSRLLHKNRDEDVVLQNKANKKGSLYKCCQCTASKLTSKKFFEHTENHVAKKFVCGICSKGYSYQRLLDLHMYKEHGDGQNDVFMCPVSSCDYTAKHKQTLGSHIKDKHQEGDQRVHRADDSLKTVSCPACGKSLRKWYYQQFHKKTCAAGLVYQCDICGQEGFVNSVTLQNHVIAKHSDERPFKCEYCDAKYATAMSLSGHRSRVHQVNKTGDPVPKKMFPCGYCGRLLTSRTKLQQHTKTIHEGTRDFKCSHCDKKFTSRSNMKIHEGTIHTGILPYKCDTCQKGFSRKQNWINHKETHHQEHMEEHSVVVSNAVAPPAATTIASLGNDSGGIKNETYFVVDDGHQETAIGDFILS